MIIVMEPGAPEEQVQAVVEALVKRGLDIHRSTGSQQVVLGAVGDTTALDPREFELLPGVHEAIRVTEPYKLVGRIFRRENTVIDLGGGVQLGGQPTPLLAAGIAMNVEVAAVLEGDVVIVQADHPH